MLLYFEDGPWVAPDDWANSIQQAYGIEVGLHDIGESLSRLTASTALHYDSYRGHYVLRQSMRRTIEEQIAAAEELETRVSTAWYSGVCTRLPPSATESQAWRILLDYCGRIFRAHGSDALELLTDVDSPRAAGPLTKTDALAAVLTEQGIPANERSQYEEAVGAFFEANNPEYSAYIGQLADSTFNLMALCTDSDSRAILQAGLPELRIFVDTNILFALLGTHDTPLAAAALDLFRVIKENRLPFTTYYHAKTAAELSTTLEDALYRITRQTWSKQVSRALVQLPWQVARLTGIEMRFHQLNAVQSIDPAAFAARYQSPAALLAQFGLRLYRHNDVAESRERMELRSSIIADYKEFLQAHPRRKNVNYVKLDHDATLWLAAKDGQAPSRKGLLFSGAFLLTSDYLLWRFDRQVMRSEYASKPVVVLPDALLQSLRPFVGGRAGFDDAAFVRIFAAPEFRAGFSAGHAETVRKVASYLATFSDLPEETATRLLADAMLMDGISRYEQSAPEFAEAIEKAIFAHNEMLVKERDTLLAERSGQLAIARGALEDASNLGTAGQRALKSIVESLERPGTTVNAIFNSGGSVISSHGDTYNNDRSQVFAQGPAASASGNAAQQAIGGVAGDPALLAQLVDIKRALLERAQSADDYEAVAGVQGAIEAFESGDEGKAVGFLRRAGQKAIDVSLEVGGKVAAAALKAAMGLDPGPN